MKPGDLVWYRQICRGGYGWDDFDVPGEFVKVSGRRWTVLLTKRDGSQVRVAVSPYNVRARVGAIAKAEGGA